MADEQQWDGERDPVEERKDAFRNEHKGKSLRDLVTQMNVVRIRKEAADEVAKLLNAEFDVLRLELIPTKMEDDGVETVRYEGIGRVSLTPDLYVSVKKGAKDELFKWFRKQKLSALITEVVNSSTLKAFVKDRMKAGKPIPQDQLNVTPFTRASITKG